MSIYDDRSSDPWVKRNLEAHRIGGRTSSKEYRESPWWKKLIVTTVAILIVAGIFVLILSI